jgi:hypothetical protein
MMFPVIEAHHGKYIAAAANHTNMRTLTICPDSCLAESPQRPGGKNALGQPYIPWAPVSPGINGIGKFSAVCYLAALEVMDKHTGPDVPIGLILNGYSGSSIEFWIPPKAFQTCDGGTALHMAPSVHGWPGNSSAYFGQIWPVAGLGLRSWMYCECVKFLLPSSSSDTCRLVLQIRARRMYSTRT